MIHPLDNDRVAIQGITRDDLLLGFGRQLNFRLFAPDGPADLSGYQVRRTIGRDSLNECPNEVRWRQHVTGKKYVFASHQLGANFALKRRSPSKL